MKASIKIMGLSAKRFLIPNLLFALVLVTSAWGASQSDPLVNELSKSSGGKVRVGYHFGTGKVRFLGVEPGAAIPQPFVLPRDATPELAARNFLGKYGILFGITDPSKELTVKRERTADRGRSFVRFQQVYKEVPVIGGELIVQMDSKRAVLSVNGKISPDPAIPTSPLFPSESAKEKALEMVGAAYHTDRALLKVSEPELWIYNPALLGKGSNANLLVWRMEVKATVTHPLKELVLVDAASGEIVLHFNQIDSALHRRIYDHDNTYGKPLPGDPADLIRSEGQGPSGITDVDLAYDYAGDTYNFYFNYHGRDSLDGAGMELISTTRFCPDFFNCPYQNAYWDGTQMVYGDGFASADDVVAHEMTHGVTEHESNLVYLNQSGAINESFSDIWGEFVDLTNGRGNDALFVRWKMGEDLPIGEIRDMSDPTIFGDPDRMLSPNYWNHQCDNGGVHINSGIGNKAAYLMTDGGSFNGKTVAGIGITKVAKIFYEAQIHLLTSASDYNDLADALQQACSTLTGIDGITASDCQQVANAIIATEMDQTPPANVLNNPGFEEGRVNWTEYSSPFYEIITQDPFLAACYSNWYAGLGGDDNLTQYIYQDVAIPSNATQVQLRFAYFIFTTESDSVIYDTMKVEIRRPSDNALLTTLVTLSNLDDTAFNYYLSDKYDLLAYKGQTVRLQFYAITDNALPTFFVVDDIVLAVLTPASIPEIISAPNTPSGPTDGVVQTSYSFTTGGSSSSLGDPIQYLFDWGDGTNSGWLSVGTTSTSKSWASAGTYLVKAKARCATDTGVESSWSSSLTVTMSSLWPNLTPYQPPGCSDKIVLTKTPCTGSPNMVDQTPFYTTDTLYLAWWIVNNGTGPTNTNAPMAIHLDGQIIHTNMIGPLQVSQTSSCCVCVSIGPLSAGTHTIRIVVDTTNAIDESNEADNEYTKIITIIPSAPPSPPTNVSATDGTYVDRVEVTWTASPGATSYTVYRATSLRRWARKTVLGTTSGTLFNDTTAVPKRTYYYWVKASNAYGTSGFSLHDVGYRSDGSPPSPTNVSASDGTYVDRVEVTWAASPGATSYTVYRAASLANWVRKTVLGTTSGTSFNDTAAIPGRIYYYWVKAANSHGTSNFSAYDAGYR